MLARVLRGGATLTTGRFQTDVTTVHGMSGTNVIHVRGRVDYHDAPELREAVLRDVSEAPGKKLILELADITTIDTAGAAVLVEALMLGRKRGLKMVLCTPSESVIRIFRLAGLQDILEFCSASPAETMARLNE